MATNELGKLPFESIAHDSAADTLRHDEPESAHVRAAGGDVHDCVGSADPFAEPDYTAKVVAANNPVRLGQHRVRGLGRDAAATLATTRSKDRTTGARTHTQTEAVLLSAAAVVGLERALAHDSPYRYSG